MKMQSIAKLFFLLALAFSITACDGDGNDRMENTEEAMEDATNDVADAFRSDQEELEAELEQSRREVNEEIEELEANLENASADAKAEMEEELAELRTWSSELDQKLQKLGSVAQDGWNDFKGDVNTTLEEIDRELSDND